MTALRVGIIGANVNGSWGSFAHLPALAALAARPGQIEAVAVAASSRASAEATAGKFGIAHAFDDPRALAEHPDVDIVSVCVRVPAHRELVMLAIEAGKHVYCEWPLGRDTAEAEALQQAAASRGVVHRVGLQARSAPTLAHVRTLLAEGAIGAVRSSGLTHSVDWITRPLPSMTYLQDRSSGAHFLSIPGGHSIDALCWLLGEFEQLSATVRTATQAVEVVGTGERIARSSADQVLVSGVLAGGVAASVRLSGASGPGTGIRLEINGDEGDLVVTAASGGRGIQMSDLRLQRTAGMAELVDVVVPEHCFRMPATARSGPQLNVGEAYLQMADAIRGVTPAASPDFADAVARHRTLDRVEAAARDGRSL